MPQNIRSILGKSGGGVKKSARPASPRQSASSASPRKTKRVKEDEKDSFQDKLEDLGLTRLLQDEASPSDVIQAMRHVRMRMFSAVPSRGFNSTRTAGVLNYRVSIPPFVTTGHLNAVLDAPSKVEREVVELLGQGKVRKVRVERRGTMGEAVMESRELEGMVRRADLSEETKDRFMAFLRENPITQTMPRSAVSNTQGDELVRAGFLTSPTQATPATTLQTRPEDRTTLTSIQHVSQFASGTVSAVGGRGAVHLAGGGGGAAAGLTRSSSSSSSELWDLRLAVPGHGRYLKLAGAAVDWVREALGRTRWGEAPEEWLRERFEAGGLYGARWREFWGLEWEWVLGEAVGLGVVEVFDTRSVGRGVRALGG